VTSHSTQPKQPQPVLTRASIVGLVAILSAVLVKLGFGQVADVLVRWEDPVAGLILLAAPFVTAVLARNHVTPNSSPKDNAGNDLVPAGSTADTDAAAAAALAQAEALYPTTPAA
jgi:hypothetical protein